jgi:hypothetical protein
MNKEEIKLIFNNKKNEVMTGDKVLFTYGDVIRILKHLEEQITK